DNYEPGSTSARGDMAEVPDHLGTVGPARQQHWATRVGELRLIGIDSSTVHDDGGYISPEQLDAVHTHRTRRGRADAVVAAGLRAGVHAGLGGGPQLLGAPRLLTPPIFPTSVRPRAWGAHSSFRQTGRRRKAKGHGGHAHGALRGLSGCRRYLSSFELRPSTRRATTSCWICCVPSKMSRILESRAHFSSRLRSE